ncbi:MAG: bifunctional 5,10-methylenetetrahydrofolate dehydrogenase/5,10-methenyltetrahydrofolate cyclohydrolase [Patescibacteria group bacterium]|jgi:methylenetetrahydrofolate dehydrogenase (NADP+)/methenyltetrahydrofolate cyclohydrolase|nr:bifunctional 5,10-methylenetetrahydrofolate dehydrogenase/5,10-methenyltetrahydrofolate cyclohydrolase [Patescibacteria group bacterium]
MNLIDGRQIAERIKDKIALEVFKLNGERPNLAIIIVEGRDDSSLYVSLKERESKKVGIDTHVYRFDNNVSEEELLDVIDFLNNDHLIDGILVQLPLPAKFNTDKIIEAVDPNKDVDGFHPDRPEYIISPVLLAVRNSLAESAIDPLDKKVCLMYNSDVFGDELREFVKTLGFSEFVDKEESNQADIIISAIAKPHSIKKEDIKKDAVLIDISTVKKGKKVLGDVDMESVKDKASYITPVPGGIGPMTIAFLLENVLKI